jgi:DNA polymerase III epsilon subunit-like protein
MKTSDFKPDPDSYEAMLLVIDTETGGTDPSRHSLLSLAAVVWVNGRIHDQIELFVHEEPIVADLEALRINRLDPVWLRENGLAPRRVTQEIELFIGRNYSLGQKVVLAGHNVAFDVGFLKRLYGLASCDFSARFSHRTFDTATVLRYLRLVGLIQLAESDSEAAFRYFHVEPPSDKRHSALGDALATAQLITRLIDLSRDACGLSRSVTKRASM